MKLIIFLVIFALGLIAGPVYSECDDADRNAQAQCADAANKAGQATGELPEDALAQVNDLNVKLRYFKAIGFHERSNQKRDEIEAIYNEHGVPLPDEFKK